ncbi:aggregation-promoting factor C-terminal-like domain-containing protein [Nocardia sp. NPDC003482]
MGSIAKVTVTVMAVCAISVCAGPAAADDEIATDSDLVEAGLGLGSSLYRLAPQTIARLIVPPDQFDSFDNIITRESGWNVFAINPTSGAYGLPQALPPFKMATHGWDWPVNPVTQIRWAYDYMNQRYGSPNAAWAFWQAHGWY